MYDLRVKDMSCGHCVRVVTEAVKSVDASAVVHVDLAQKRVRIASRNTLQELGDALAEAGYPAEPIGGA